MQLKIEERKLRALNRTGRVDFAIQELVGRAFTSVEFILTNISRGAFDISLIASIEHCQVNRPLT